MILLAGAIGAVGGLLGVGFQLGLNWLQRVVVGPGDRLSEAVTDNLSALETVLVPTFGGVLAGLVLLLVRKQRESPFGITDIVRIVALRRGTIRLRASLVQICASACTIGTGGSIGKEGANSQISATVAAQLARWFRVGSRSRSVLLGCGVAAGMATSYNAPIAGAIFVMEAVLGNFAMDVFAPIVVASVLATMMRHALLGEDVALYASALSQQALVLSWQLILSALLLGVMCGVGGVLFRRALRHGRSAFQRLGLPVPLALGLGGLVVGLIGLQQPAAWGNGFEVIESIASSPLPVTAVLSLFLWKVVATVATVGSGGLGGIFTPNLVVGAAFGAFFAYAVAGFTGAPGVSQNETVIFTFVGMAGLCAALTHAPVTAIVLLFELTRHYELVLPIMLCSITASIVARMLDADSYYTEAMRAKGEELPTGLEELAIKTTYVRDVMRSDLLTVAENAGFPAVMARLAQHKGDTIYVVDDDGVLVGRIQLQDVKNFINDPTLSSVVIAHDLMRPVVAASPDDSLARLLPEFDSPEIGEVAVVVEGGDERPRLIGRVRQQDVIAGIRSEVLDQQQRRAQLRAGRRTSDSIQLPDGWQIARIQVAEEWDGLTVDNLPEELQGWLVPMLVVEPDERGERRLPATPEHVLVPGARIVALCRTADLERWQQAPRTAPAAAASDATASDTAASDAAAPDTARGG